MKAASTPLGIVVRLGRDTCLLVVGIIGLLYVPPSVEHFADRAHLVGVAWAAMFTLGSILGLLGIIREQPFTELAGCGFIAAAFALWAIAAVTAPDVTWATVQVSLVFVGAIFGQVYRAWLIANGRIGR